MNTAPACHRTPAPRCASSLAELASAPVSGLPPHDREAEQAVLGGVLLSNKTLSLLASVVRDEDFFFPAHRMIWQAMLGLFEASQPVDLLTVADTLARAETLEAAGGRAYLGELAAAIVPSANAEYFAGRVRELAGLRQLMGTGVHMVRESQAPGAELSDLLDRTGAALLRIESRRQDTAIFESGSLVTETLNRLADLAGKTGDVTGVTTGYSRLNEYTAGWQRSDLIILAARPSMGKTALALNFVRNATLSGTAAAVFSLEMSKEQLMARLLCMDGEIDLQRFRRGWLHDDEWSRLRAAGARLSALPLFINDTPALNVMEMRGMCRRLARERGLGLVVVDYLQLMRAARRVDNREQEIAEISRSLKALAKELNIPVIALSQLNRKVEERSNRRPMLSDLRESGSLEQDADVIAFIYRDEVYNKESPKKGTAEIIIGKQRNGPIGEIELRFEGPSGRFLELYEPIPERT